MDVLDISASLKETSGNKICLGVAEVFRGRPDDLELSGPNAENSSKEHQVRSEIPNEIWEWAAAHRVNIQILIGRGLRVVASDSSAFEIGAVFGYVEDMVD